MNIKDAIDILSSEDNDISIDNIVEAIALIEQYDNRKRKKLSSKNYENHTAWMKRNKELSDLRDEIKKYWKPSKSS